MESSFHKREGGAESGWTLADFAEANRFNLKQLIAHAKDWPLPTIRSTVLKRGKCVNVYTRSDLKAWYAKVRASGAVSPRAQFACPLCGANGAGAPDGKYKCHDCGRATLKRSSNSRVFPDHGNFAPGCPCSRCRIYYGGRGTVKVNVRYGESPFDIQADSVKQVAFFSAFAELSLDLSYIATEVFRERDRLTIDLWAQRVRLFGLEIHGRRGRFVKGPVTPEHLEELAKLIESLDD